MAGKTTIEWTHMPGYVGGVWNPTTGCTRVSAGCDNCYAFALHDRRYKANLDHARANGEGSPAMMRMVLSSASLTVDRDLWPPFPKQYDLPFSRVQLLEDRLDVPLRTRKPTCYFVDSMADLFHEDVPFDFIDRVWLRMVLARRHKFLVLTKRPERMRAYCDREMQATDEDIDRITPLLGPEERAAVGRWAADYLRGGATVAPNVWLGTSVEDQAAADERIPHLLATPAAVRFLSCEPLLGPLDLSAWLDIACYRCTHPRREHYFGENGGTSHCCWGAFRDECGCTGYVRNARPWIDWVIVGGESGSRARPMDLAWARSLVQQCKAAGVAAFVKQLGSVPVQCDEATLPGEPFAIHLHESHGRDMSEWPEDLRVREWPR